MVGFWGVLVFYMKEWLQSAVQEFGVLDECEVIDRGTGQGQVSRYEICTSRERWMAKMYPPSSPTQRDWLQYECELLHALKQHGFPVADSTDTISGDRFTTIQDRPLILYEWAEGYIQWPPTPENAQKLGRVLAEMHLAVSNYSSPVTPRQYNIDRLVDHPLRLLEPFAESGSAEWKELLRLTDLIRSKIANVPLNSETFGPIHGDMHQGNCFFRDDGQLGVFDFGLCGVGYRTYDLTGFLWPMRDDTILQPEMREACDNFIDGYRSVRPLTQAEEDSLMAFIQVRTLWETGDWIDTGTGKQQPDDIKSTVGAMTTQFNRFLI